MGLPSEEAAASRPVNGTPHDDAARDPSYQRRPSDNLQHPEHMLSHNTLQEPRPPHERSGRSRDQIAEPTNRRGDGRRPSGQSQRTCGKCQTHLSGQFVRALGSTYHIDCFTCRDCNKIVASKFFPVPDQPPNQYPLCEVDYFRRLDLLCHACGGALRGSYITALDRKYHIEHFTCSVCPTIFGAQDSYYEHEGDVFCHYHYSTKFAQKCNGCSTAILKQFVEIFRNGANQHWHPECYMIHKYWNVRLGTSESKKGEVEAPTGERSIDVSADASEAERNRVKHEEESVEHKVHIIWQTLSTFEERSATCISAMLLHVSDGGYMEGVMAAKSFIIHVEVLFAAADDLDRQLQMCRTMNANAGVRTADSIIPQGLSYNREAKLLCKKVVAFFQLLAGNQETGVRRIGVTQHLLSLVTGLAHYLKLMIRICLSGALKSERDSGTSQGLERFLRNISRLDEKLEAEARRDRRLVRAQYVESTADMCVVCSKAVEDRCFRVGERSLHTSCLSCSQCGKELQEQPSAAYRSDECSRIWCEHHAPPDAARDGFQQVSRLQQYIHLLRVAHARLIAKLKTSGALPHTSDDPNLGDYKSSEPADRLAVDGPPLLRSNTRSKSYAGRSAMESSVEDTMGDVRRLRSTRMDKQLSNAGRYARKSRVIDGPQGMRPGTADGDGRPKTGAFHVVQDAESSRDQEQSQLAMSNQDGLTLDDIPRIVQAQQTKEQRPNASRFARQSMIPQEPKPKLVNGHTRDFSGDAKPEGRPPGTKKYFSELTALEYFIVRHVAVLSMEPLLEGHFNQEELLDLIETKRPTFWSKFGKAFQGKEKKGKVSKTAIFGVSLDQLLERDYEESTDGVGPGSLKVPSLVQQAVSAMKTMDMSVEGVFRKNGNIKRLNEVRDTIDAAGAVQVDLTRENAVQVAALLKKFLRELPDPLLTHKLHKLWITSQKIDDIERRRRLLHLTCCLLPKVHRDTMEVLFTFMNWVSSFSHVDEESGSKMDIHNLATVLTPNIIHRGKEVMPVDDSFLAIEAVHSLIECNETMCEVPEDLAMILNDSSLFSKSPDITTKEILKRYGDRAKAPQMSSAGHASAFNRPAEGLSSAHRVDTDPNMATAWGNESSVRHVGGEHGTPPMLLVEGARDSPDSGRGPRPTARSRQKPVGVV